MFYHALTGNGGTTPVEDLEPVLLWENSNISAIFEAQKVSLDLNDYVGVIVEFNRATGSTAHWLANRSFIKKGETGLGAGNIDSTNSADRNFSCDNTGVTFESGYVNSGENNEAIIPIKIYGVKEYVVEPVNNLQLITTSQDKTVTFTAENNVNYLVIESACNTTGAVGIRDCSVDNGELEVLKHLVEAKLETYTALIKNAVGTVNYSSAATSDFEMILIFKLVG